MARKKLHAILTDEELLTRVLVDSSVCSGRPYIRGTRIQIAVILDALSEGLSPRQVLEHYPALNTDDLRAAIAYACKLARENDGLAVLNPQRGINESLQLR
jgi:uncharacterized protein (DUF433 family)